MIFQGNMLLSNNKEILSRTLHQKENPLKYIIFQRVACFLLSHQDSNLD